MLIAMRMKNFVAKLVHCDQRTINSRYLDESNGLLVTFSNIPVEMKFEAILFPADFEIAFQN